LSSSDFRQITIKGQTLKAERLFRAAVSAFCSLTRPSRREIAQLEDLALPLFDFVSVESRRYVAAALSECQYAPAMLVRRLADETVEYLVLYRWPGNVRQLANEVRRMVALAEPGAVLMPAHLSDDIAASRRTVPTTRPVLQSTEVMTRLDQPLAAALEHIERAAIQRAVAVAEGNLIEAAKMLGLSRKGLYLKRRRLGLE